jgi:nucleotide-binding universal stress UspA family protein
MKLLLAIDDSEFSEAATQAVIAQFRPQDAEVKVLNVVENTEYVDYPAGVTENQLNQAHELTNRASQKLRTAGFKVESAACRGDARAGIIDTAEEWNADLIVIGSHGRTGLGRFVLGSVSDAVMRHAHCSVEIVRFRQGKDQEK